MARIAIGGFVALVIAACAVGPVRRPAPLGLDRYVPVPEGSPWRAREVRLGRSLFHDRRLSADGSLSCASCHEPDNAFAEARPTSVGVSGRRGHRNAPTLVNRAWGRSFFWDGRTSSLEEQVLRPIEDPNELGSSAQAAAARVGQSTRTLARALAAYVRSIQSGDSAVDRFDAGDRSALSDQAQLGLRVFRGKGRCVQCHVGPTFTDESFHNTGVAWVTAPGAPAALDQSGLGHFNDDGRFAITGREHDRGAFKTPTLREIARTAPYMHDGSLATLDAVVDFYDRGGRPNPYLDASVRPVGFTPEERRGLVEFLEALSGTVLDGQ